MIFSGTNSALLVPSPGGKCLIRPEQGGGWSSRQGDKNWVAREIRQETDVPMTNSKW